MADQESRGGWGRRMLRWLGRGLAVLLVLLGP